MKTIHISYGGPYDSYTIPAPEGEPTDPWHERELRSERYDHDAGWWVEGGEPIPLRIVHEDVLFKLQEDAEAAAAPTPAAQADSEQLSALEIHAPNQSGEASCLVRWQVETPAGWVGAWSKEALEFLLARPQADSGVQEDAARYRAFFAAGLPIGFLGQEYHDKRSLDAAIDAALAQKEGNHG